MLGLAYLIGITARKDATARRTREMRLVSSFGEGLVEAFWDMFFHGFFVNVGDDLAWMLNQKKARTCRTIQSYVVDDRFPYRDGLTQCLRILP